MLSPNFTILYVRDALASASFYTRLLGREPVESAPTFAMFALDGGVMLGLWTRAGVEPTPVVEAGAVELGFVQPDRAAVDALHQRWVEQGLTIAQAPTDLDFGYTFVALDPDGHRLRPFNPTPNPPLRPEGMAMPAQRLEVGSPRNWLAVACASHVARGLAGGFMQVCHGKCAPLKRMVAGDRVVYYSPGQEMGGPANLRAFTALGQVLPVDPYQVDMSDLHPGFHPYRRDVRWASQGRQVAIQSLRGQLELTATPGWGAKLRFGLLQISAADMDCIAAALAVGALPPVEPMPAAQGVQGVLWAA